MLVQCGFSTSAWYAPAERTAIRVPLASLCCSRASCCKVPASSSGRTRYTVFRDSLWVIRRKGLLRDDFLDIPPSLLVKNTSPGPGVSPPSQPIIPVTSPAGSLLSTDQPEASFATRRILHPPSPLSSRSMHPSVHTGWDQGGEGNLQICRRKTGSDQPIITLSLVRLLSVGG